MPPATPPATTAGSGAELSQTAQSNLHILASEKVVKVNCSSDEVAFDFVLFDSATAATHG